MVHPAITTVIAFSPDGRFLVTAGRGEIMVRDARDGRLVGVVRTDDDGIDSLIDRLEELDAEFGLDA